jgi:PAS domain S-box-containing protein
MSPLQFFDEDDKGRVKNAILNAFEKGAANVEAPFMTKSGQKTPYYFTGKFVNFEGFPCLLGLGIDISERKKAEERYGNIFENSLQGIYQSTPEGKFITVNPAMAKIFGYNSPEELIDLISDIGTQLYANPEDRQHMKHLLELHGQINGLELRALKKNKEIIWVNINNRAIKDEQGSIIYLEGILKDVTEGKLAEEKLRHQFEELQKTNFELDRFVYSVSHDLRAPLASILGLINVAQLEKSSDSENKYWEMVRNSVSRLDGFIKDILDYSSNSRMEIRNDEIDFPKIMQEAQNNLSYLSGIERLKIATEVSGGLPFYSDETRIKIILNNLICNVIKFQDSTKESNYFKLSVTITTQQAHINVSDNGIGIEKMHLDKIFKMFYRASENSKGSGLGLYITKETVLKLGGTIEVQSEFGKGTRFDILIPNQNRVR